LMNKSEWTSAVNAPGNMLFGAENNLPKFIMWNCRRVPAESIYQRER